MCKSAVFLTILCSICFAQAQSVALSGVVKLSNGTPVEGVTVSLAGLSSLSILTKQDGTFSLKNTSIRVTSVPSTPPNRHFTLQGNSILFTPTDLNAGLDVRVYTNDGRIISSPRIPGLSAGNNRVTLPLFCSGVYYIAVKTGDMEIIHPLLHVGNKIYCKNGAVARTRSGAIPAAKKKAAGSVIDTLIAKKDGYIPAEHPLTSYEQNAIEVILEPENSVNITSLSVRANPNSVLSAYVSWTTEAAATSKVQFGEGGLQCEIAHAETVTKHEVLVIGMRAKTKYQIRAISGLAKADTSFTTGTLPAHIPIGNITVRDTARVQPGWTLMNVQKGDGSTGAKSTAPPTAVAYDEEGYPVWYYVNGTDIEVGGAISVDRTDKGVLMGPTLAPTATGGPPFPPIEVDWAGKTLWTCQDPRCGQPDQLSHHAGKLSNGNYIVERNVGAPNYNQPVTEIWYEYSPGSQTPVHSIGIEDGMPRPKSGTGDWAHGNSITVDLDNDIAYLSSRWLGLMKMKYSTKQLIWHLPAKYGQNQLGIQFGDMRFVPPTSQFSDIHDPEIHDDGTILFFDNGGYKMITPIPEGNPYGFHTRALEYAIDETAKTATLTWEWPGNFAVDSWYKTQLYVPFWGDADRLQNGNVLITAGRRGTGAQTPESTIIEVHKESGEVVWELKLPKDYGVYRSERVYPLPLVRPIGK
jgi:hypothetical protein